MEHLDLDATVSRAPVRRGDGAFRRQGLLLAGAAAALLALGALVPTLLSSAPEAPSLPANPTQVGGRLACLECELAGKKPRPGLESLLPGAQATPAASGAATRAHGRLHLRDDGGRFWELAPEGAEAGALDHHDLAGRRVTVFGRIEPEWNVVRVARLVVQPD